ncbi:DUF397 domain-containing protein [Nocardiopsis sediminis]|uniref:DUF397 domain-containing protein n=1 Tax=Nocardiopsis sediminis TaxID=1778267 RepID=A0ABV8FQB3_9ACTN
MNWHKSTYSGANPNCVEVAEARERVHVRDTQYRHLTRIEFPSNEWHVFMTAVKSNEL